MALNDRITEFDESESGEDITLMSSHVMPVSNGLLLFRFGSLFDIKNTFPLRTIDPIETRISNLSFNRELSEVNDLGPLDERRNCRYLDRQSQS
jgi:hypothetical protein